MKKLISLFASVALLGIGLSAAGVGAQATSKAQAGGAKPAAEAAPAAKAQMDEAAMIAKQLPSYPLTSCPISGKAFEATSAPTNLLYNGRLVRLCCPDCKKAFDKDPAAVMAKIDAAIVQAQTPIYPLTTCPVSGEALDSMGEPVDYVVGTRLVRLCCKGCIKQMQKDPSEAMAKVDAALIEKLKPTYPATVCLVSGEALDSMGEPIDYLYGTQLVRFCCKGCIKKFEKEPAAFVAKLKGEKAMPEKKAEKAGEKNG